MSIATALAFALSPLVSEPQQATFDVNKQPDLCAVDPATVVPVDTVEGSTATYAIQVRAVTDKMEAFLAALDSKRFGVFTVLTSNFSVLFVSTRTLARNADQIRNEVAQLCKLSDFTPIRLVMLDSHDSADRRRVTQKRAKEKRLQARAAAQATAEAKSKHRQLMRTHPNIEELNTLIREQWKEAMTWFADVDTGMDFNGDTRFGKVREVRCRRTQGLFRCKVGILLLRAGEPDFAMVMIDFWRDKEGKLAIHEPELIVT